MELSSFRCAARDRANMTPAAGWGTTVANSAFIAQIRVSPHKAKPQDCRCKDNPASNSLPNCTADSLARAILLNGFNF